MPAMTLAVQQIRRMRGGRADAFDALRSWRIRGGEIPGQSAEAADSGERIAWNPLSGADGTSQPAVAVVEVREDLIAQTEDP